MPLPTVYVYGNLTVDPELRFLNDGTPVASLRVACNERYKKDNEWVDGSTTFLKVNAWRGVAENATNHLKKGDPVYIAGKLKQNEYLDQNGEKRISIELEAQTIAKGLKSNSESSSW